MSNLFVTLGSILTELGLPMLHRYAASYTRFSLVFDAVVAFSAYSIQKRRPKYLQRHLGFASCIRNVGRVIGVSKLIR